LIEVDQLEEAAQTHDSPRLAVQWSSHWGEFVSSLGPAFSRSHARLAGEAPFGLIPLRIMIPSYVLEAFLIFVAIVVPSKLAELRPYVAPRLASHDVIYYSGDELPRTQDLSGAQTGASGRAGGDEIQHRSQTIRIARGSSLVPQIVDAPNLRLPASRDAVANLLAIQPNPGPPPVDGLRANRNTPGLSTIVAPAPTVTRDYTRNGIQLAAVVPPAPNFSPNQRLVAPALNPNVIPPAPNVSQHALVAPALGAAVIPPAPAVSGDQPLTAPRLTVPVIAPAPSVARETARSSPSYASSVIPPAPNVSQPISGTNPQRSNVAVVPPPASAPEKATARASNLSLPAPSVIAPPPSANGSPDLGRTASNNAPRDPFSTVVPPPPSQPTSGSFMSSLIGRIFGSSEVVPPPPAVKADAGRSGSGASLSTNVVPPPPAVAATGTTGNPHGKRGGSGTPLASDVIAPPPSAGVSGIGGAHSLESAAAPNLGPPSVVPPPPSLSGPGGGTGSNGGGAGVPKGSLLANNVVPPPPSIGGGSGTTGLGLGRSGAGAGRPMDVGSPTASPTGGGGSNSGAVVSSQPGSKVGMPTTGGTGSLSMSPVGGLKPGVGGSGGGTSIGRGNGPGSGMEGEHTGAARTGSGHGADADAHGGISSTSGPGGAGNAPSGNPPIRGVDISGGTGVVTLPSFGSDPSANDPNNPNRSSFKQRRTLGVEVVATATSGGPFEPYKDQLHGETHTIYPDTSSALGAAVMQYADESPKGRDPLTGPQPIRTTLPEGLPRARMVVRCTLDASGDLRNFHVLEPGPAAMTEKILTALRAWKFQPAMRAGQPVEVTAIVGFNINTDDRF